MYLGLLYTYCPAAAGFWQAGAPVGPRTLPYNGAWQVLSDYASGDATLSDKLEGFGVSEPMIKDVVGYVEAIKHYRRKYPYKDAPELEHTDELVKADKVLRFGLQNVFDDHFGGNWRNVYEYGRLWCYVLMDWARHIDGDQDKVREFKVERAEYLHPFSEGQLSCCELSYVFVDDDGKRRNTLATQPGVPGRRRVA